MRKNAALITMILGLSLLPTHTRVAKAASDHPLEGVWQVAEQGGPAGAGIYMFAATHYSMVLAASNRPDLADTSKATADELRAAWGPLAANAGVYETAGDLLTIRPVVAKIPAVMAAGAYEVYAFRVEDKTLYLTQRRNIRGPVQGTATVKLVRVE
jgi:hypothetical protein